MKHNVKKVLFVITKGDEIGGAQVHVLDLCRQMLTDGMSVRVVVGEDGLFVDLLRENDISFVIDPSLVRHISPVNDFSFLFRLRKQIREFSPEVVHLHSSKAGLIGRFSCLGMSTKCVFTAHGWSFTDGISKKKRLIYALIERYTSALLDSIITVSHYDKQLALHHNIAHANKINVIHNGVCPIPSPPFPLNSDDSCVNIVMVARFSNQKDHFSLFSALSLVENNNWKLHLVGKGDLQPQAVRQVQELGIASKVVFLGERNDVFNILSGADIFCLISNWEGFPISIVEAMQIGLPIVASDVGGVSESVFHGENGFLVERKNISEIRNSLEKLIDNKLLREQFSLSSKNKYIENFSFDEMYRRTLYVYNTLPFDN